MTLALSLHIRGIPCTIFEKEGRNNSEGSSVSIMPNAARLLDELGIYDKLKDQGFLYDAMHTRNRKNEILASPLFGSVERYGYNCLRLHRRTLIMTLSAAVETAGIQVYYNKAFSCVATEPADDDTVKFEFRDGSTYKATLLIGADGIHSLVREYVAPGVRSQYTGPLGLFVQLPRSKIRFPKESTGGKDYLLPSTIIGTHPAWGIIAETQDMSSILSFTLMFNHPDIGREGFEQLNCDKAKIKELLLLHQDYWDDPIKSVLESLDNSYDLFIWPTRTLPPLERWISEDGKVLVVGDAAHAMLPSSGQGANSAIEDAVTLSVLLGHVFGTSHDKIELRDALDFWQKTRQARIQLVQNLARENMQQRLPEAERQKIPGLEVIGGSEEQRNDWLMLARVREEMEDWVAAQGHA